MTNTAPTVFPVAAIDLQSKLDASTGNPWIVLTLIAPGGARIDCPLPASHAAAFGEALADFAAEVAYE